LAHAQSPLDALLTQAVQSSPEAKVLALSQEKIGYQRLLDGAQLRPSLGLTSNLPGFTRSINSITQPDGTLLFLTQSQAFSSVGIFIKNPISNHLLN